MDTSTLTARAPLPSPALPARSAAGLGSVSAGPLPMHCDLLVVGSGAGGLSTAVTAAALGLKVVVLEKEAQLGGTTAWSGGWMWIPRNPLAVEAGIREEPDAPRTYLRHELGDRYDEARIEAFLAHGPRMVEFFRHSTALEFIGGNAVPDFHGRSPGAREGGRSVCAKPYDARELGEALAFLRPPLDLISPWGMGIASGTELRHFLNAMRSARSFAYVAQRTALHFRDLLLHGRGMRLVAGNALVARLLRSALDRGVQLRVSSPVRRLLMDDGRVTGAVVSTGQGEVRVQARCGVVLAGGGFPHDLQRQRELFPTAAQPHHSAAPTGNTGDGLRLGESAGGVVVRDQPHPGAWTPVSVVRRADGSTGHFPHLIERAKPGVIAVTPQGRRFANEADSYHDFMSALLAATPPGRPAEAWLVCDHRFIRRFGLGHVRPAPLPLGPSLRSGYLRRGRSIEALAQACGIEVPALRATIEHTNADARRGQDSAFGRGSTPYNRAGGEPGLSNPCVAPIEQAPFYAVRLVAGSLGTFAGLRTDDGARVLDARGEPIPGLWAAGNDMASLMGGRYPSGGITLGPAMTFGFIAAHSAAEVDAGATVGL